MTKKNFRIRKAYEFFCESEKTGSLFTLEDIAKNTGWSKSTIKSYLSKKWHFFIKPFNGEYICENISNLSEDAFVRLHSQKFSTANELFRPMYSPTIDALIDKARESALLAIQIYNNPLLVFRAPGYIVQIVIAFTALFHAIFEKESIVYWYSDDDGNPIIIDGDRKYWELEQCIRFFYKGTTTPETENLRLLAGLRNKVVHRFMPTLEIHISGFCQAALLNFERLLINEFGKYFSLHNNIFLALQITEFSNDLDNPLRKLQASRFQEIRSYIEDFCNNLPDNIVQSPNFSFRAFLIPKIGNHAKSSDIAIEFIKYDKLNEDDMKKYEKQIALIKEKTIQVADQGKYLPSVVIEEVYKRTGIRLRMHDHTQAWKYYHVRTSDKNPSKCKTKFCQYSEPFRKHIYTDAWIDFLSEKIIQSDELEKIRLYRE